MVALTLAACGGAVGASHDAGTGTGVGGGSDASAGGDGPPGGAPACTAACPVTLASRQFSPIALAVDSTSVYWVNLGPSPEGPAEGAVVKAPLGGGAPVTLAAGQAQPIDLAIDGSRVYWVNEATGSDGGTVMSVPLAGGPASTLASLQLGPVAIGLDATNVYWVTDGIGSGQGVTSITGALMKAPLGGGCRSRSRRRTPRSAPTPPPRSR